MPTIAPPFRHNFSSTLLKSLTIKKNRGEKISSSNGQMYTHSQYYVHTYFLSERVLRFDNHVYEKIITDKLSLTKILKNI